MQIQSSEIADLRLNSQQLRGTSLKTANDMVRWFTAVQAQEYALSKWGLGLRLPHLKDTDIEQELTEGKILRTHLLRPTWHFVTSGDIRWLLKLTAPRVNAVSASMYRQLELDDKAFKKYNKILGKILKGGKHLTREEIRSEFNINKIETKGLRFLYILARGELDGIICSGARKGNQSTYALLDERVPHSREPGWDEALAELTIRYFQSRGPATVDDFSTWSGLTKSDCRKGIEICRYRVDTIRSGKNEYYLLPGANPVTKPSTSMFLLPPYDEYIMGYRDRSAILEFKERVRFGFQSRFDSTIIYNGQIIGTWKRIAGRKEIQLDYDLFGKLSKSQERELEKIVRRFGSFNNLPVSIFPIAT